MGTVRNLSSKEERFVDVREGSNSRGRVCVCVCKNVPNKMKAVPVKAQYNSHLLPFLLALSANSTKATAEMPSLSRRQRAAELQKLLAHLQDCLRSAPIPCMSCHAEPEPKPNSDSLRAERKINQRDVEAEPCLFLSRINSVVDIGLTDFLFDACLSHPSIRRNTAGRTVGQSIGYSWCRWKPKVAR